MRPTNYNANRALREAINHLAEALPARFQTRSESIAFALRAINKALNIQPDIRRAVEQLNHPADCLGKE